MPTEIEFGSRDGANSFRDDFGEYLTDRYDRRHKTIELVDDAPDHVLEKADARAERGKAERETGAGQVPLTDAEKDRIDFSKDGANTMHARSVKALFHHRGLDSWVDHYDPTLEVDEHESIIERLKETGAAGGGARLDESAESKREKRAKQLEKAQGEQCEHARSACEEQHPEACEFLRESCGYTDEEIEEILGFVDERAALEEDDGEQQELVTVGGGEYAEMDVTPKQAGALKRSWRGYRGALGTLRDALDEVRESVGHARRAMRAVNAIRETNGRDPIEPNDLNELLDALEGMPESIPVLASLDEYVDEGQERAVSDEELRSRAPTRPEHTIPERPEGLDAQTVETCDELTERYGIRWQQARALCRDFDSRHGILDATPDELLEVDGVGDATVNILSGGDVVDSSRPVRWNREQNQNDAGLPGDRPKNPRKDGVETAAHLVVGRQKWPLPRPWDGWDDVVAASQHREFDDENTGEYVAYVCEGRNRALVLEGSATQNKWAMSAWRYAEPLPENPTGDDLQFGPDGVDGNDERERLTHGNTASPEAFEQFAMNALTVDEVSKRVSEPADDREADVIVTGPPRNRSVSVEGEVPDDVLERYPDERKQDRPYGQFMHELADAVARAFPEYEEVPPTTIVGTVYFEPGGTWRFEPVEKDVDQLTSGDGERADVGADWAIVDNSGEWETYAYDRERAEKQAEKLSNVPANESRAPFEVVPASDASPDPIDEPDDDVVDWPEALERVRAQYDDSYGDRVSFAADVRRAVNGPIPQELADEGVTQPILRYQDVAPADARNQIDARAGENADRVVEAIREYADTLEPVEPEREPVHGTGIRFDRSGRDVPEKVAEKIGALLLEADTPEERQRVADENAARLERMGYDAEAASEALEYAEFVAGTDPGDPNLRTAIDDAYGRSTSTSTSSNQQFAREQQGTLDVGVESEETAEEKQVTLSGRDAGNVEDTAPSEWRREGSTWKGGPYSVQMDSHDGNRWNIRVYGPNDRDEIASNLPSATVAEKVARGFTERVAPNEISFHHSDSTVPEAAAAAKAEALDEQDSGITNY